MQHRREAAYSSGSYRTWHARSVWDRPLDAECPSARPHQRATSRHPAHVALRCSPILCRLDSTPYTEYTVPGSWVRAPPSRSRRTAVRLSRVPRALSAVRKLSRNDWDCRGLGLLRSPCCSHAPHAAPLSVTGDSPGEANAWTHAVGPAQASRPPSRRYAGSCALGCGCCCCGGGDGGGCCCICCGCCGCCCSGGCGCCCGG
jgi:hypothetical protein